MVVDVDDFIEFLSKEKAQLNKLLLNRSIVNKQKQYWMYLVGKRDLINDLRGVY